MSDPERRIVRDLTELGRLEPSPAAVDRALNRAADTLKPYRFRRLIMRSSIAAALILTVSLLLVLLPRSEASAVEQLAKAAQTTAAYKGWVHQKVRIEVLDEAAIRKKAKDAGQPDMQMPVGHEAHSNTVNGSNANVMRFADGRVRIELMYVPDRTWSVYDSADGKVRISVMPEATADSLIRARQMQPWSAEGLIKFLRKSGNFEHVEVTSRQDGGLQRFELTVKAPDSTGPLPKTIWADPDNGLIQKSVGEMREARFTAEYTYGAPTITNIYDVGAPRDTQIVDNRPSEDLEQVYQAIDEARGEGVGDYVALMSEVYVDENGEPRLTVGAIHLLARRREAWLYCRYLLGANTYDSKQSRGVAVPMPQAWPKPALDPLLEVLFPAKPTEYIVHNGEEGWRGLYEADGSGPQIVFSTQDHQGAVMIASWKKEKAVEYDIWPAREADEGTRTEIIRDEQHAGLIGLRTSYKPRGLLGLLNSVVRSPKTVWVDPARNYVRVESESSTTSQQMKVNFRSTVTEFAQLPDGRWFPASWNATHETFNPQGKPMPTQRDQYVLQIFPGRTLNDVWFTDPAERLK